ncbi:hypothetical protein N665_0568s0024 [Sinapis alba]|nr:hypothetical protein N665_0568s0024 [Sinapis alba]
MARISLLLFIAVVLAIGSVSAHPPKKTKKNLCPPTLSQLQTFPSIEISKLIEKKIKSAPNTPQFNTLFSICKAFSDYLAVFKGTAVKSVFGSVHTKYAVMSEAIDSAQAAIGVEGKLAAGIRKSYREMADGFVELEQMIAEISGKYKFEANAAISKEDRFRVDKCLIKLKGSINVYVKAISKCSARFSGKQMLNPVAPGGYLDGFIKKGLQLGGNFLGGGFGGHAGGAIGGNVGDKVEGHAGGNAGAQGEVKLGGNAGAGVGVGGLVGGMVGGRGRGKAGGRGKGKVGGNVGAQGEVKIGGQAGAGGKVGGHVGGNVGAQGEVKLGGQAGVGFGGKGRGKVGGKGRGKVGGKVGAQGEVIVGGNAGAELGAKAGAKVGGNAGAKVGGNVGAGTEVNVGRSAGGFLGEFEGFGRGVQYDAAGKAQLGGGNVFRPLSRTSSKHLD